MNLGNAFCFLLKLIATKNLIWYFWDVGRLSGKDNFPEIVLAQKF